MSNKPNRATMMVMLAKHGFSHAYPTNREGDTTIMTKRLFRARISDIAFSLSYAMNTAITRHFTFDESVISDDKLQEVMETMMKEHAEKNVQILPTGVLHTNGKQGDVYNRETHSSTATELCFRHGHAMYPVYSLQNEKIAYGLNKCSRCDHQDPWEVELK